MNSEKPLVDKDYLLDKFPGKGGWTYTLIPEIPPDSHAPFGWVKVKGSIDGIEICDYHLMPYYGGSQTLFLSVKADIRKKIRKEAGDTVHVILYRDEDPLEVPEELLLCIRDDANAQAFFNLLNDGERHKFVKWIYSAKSEKTRIDRMAKTIVALAEHRKYNEL